MTNCGGATAARVLRLLVSTSKVARVLGNSEIHMWPQRAAQQRHELQRRYVRGVGSPQNVAISGACVSGHLLDYLPVTCVLVAPATRRHLLANLWLSSPGGATWPRHRILRRLTWTPCAVMARPTSSRYAETVTLAHVCSSVGA